MKKIILGMMLGVIIILLATEVKANNDLKSVIDDNGYNVYKFQDGNTVCYLARISYSGYSGVGGISCVRIN